MSIGLEWHTAMQHDIDAIQREMDGWHEDLRQQCLEINELLDRMDAGSNRRAPVASRTSRLGLGRTPAVGLTLPRLHAGFRGTDRNCDAPL